MFFLQYIWINAAGEHKNFDNWPQTFQLVYIFFINIINKDTYIHTHIYTHIYKWVSDINTIS